MKDIDEILVSSCCGAEFGPPGWPDCDELMDDTGKKDESK